MSIPVHAKVRAVPNFISCLKAARDSMVDHSATGGAARFAKLQAELVKARSLLSFAPTSGRPARFLVARTAWGRFKAEQAAHLAGEAATPELRELVLARHVLLYAHNENEVVLLSLRHERQLGYALPSER